MSKEQLDALSPETLAERQRLVDAAVRYSRDNNLCGEFDRALGVLMPEMAVTNSAGRAVWYDSDGVDCRWNPLAEAEFNRNGYDADGFDRDGYSRYGTNRDGRTRYYVEHMNDEPAFRFDVHGYDENGRDAHGYDRDGFDPDGYNPSGYHRNGNRRQGREATAEEIAAQAAPFNPTTYKPTA